MGNLGNFVLSSEPHFGYFIEPDSLAPFPQVTPHNLTGNIDGNVLAFICM